MAEGSSPASVVFIAGVPRSGSTLLAILLGSHSQIVAGGELSVFSRRGRSWHGDPLEKPCSCGAERAPLCPFWSEVDRDLSDSDGLSLATLDVENEDPATFTSHNRALLRSLRRVSGKPFVVDSSKHLNRFERLDTIAGVHARPILLERQISGIAYSHMKRGADLYERAVHSALVYFTLGRRLEPERTLKLHLENLASRPREELSRVVRWLGLEFEEAQLSWATSDVHLVSGSPMRLARTGVMSLDEAWRNELTPWQQLRLLLISQRRHYGGVRAIAARVLARGS